MFEKRRYLRMPAHTPVRGKAAFVSQLRDISIDGCFLEFPARMEIGAQMQLEITLPNTTKVLEVVGEVRWCGEYSSDHKTEVVVGIGIKFTEVTVGDIALISEYLKNYATDKRRFRRIEIKFPVKVSVDNQQDGFFAQAIDISLGGLFIKTDQVFELNSVLFLEFKLPKVAQAISCAAKVVYLNRKIPDLFDQMIHQGMGVEFFDISESALRQIDHLLKSLNEESQKTSKLPK